MAIFNRRENDAFANWKAPTQAWTASSHKILSKAFAVTGIAFVAICLIGIIVSVVLTDKYAYAASIGPEKILSDLYPQIRALSIASFALLIIANVLIIVWQFRIRTSSFAFIFVVYATYIVAQGIGFGFLFFVLNIKDIISIFGIGGGLFLAMAAVGTFSKNLSGLRPYLIWGTVLWLGMSIVSMILYFSGVYNSTLILLTTILAGLLFLAYTAYDVWMLRKSAEWANTEDASQRWKIIFFFGFRLLADLIMLIWFVARIFLISKK